MRWSLGKEKQRGVERYVIRRWINGELKRLPVEKYRSIRDNYEELEKFVLRLNAPIDLKIKVDFKHAFIDDELLSEYEDNLHNTITAEGLIGTEIGYVKNYFLHYFITLQGVMDPAKWIALESKWLTYIINDPTGPKHLGLKGIKAATTKRKVISAANRFMHWLHKRRPEEVPKIEFETIAKKKFNAIQAKRELDEDTNSHSYIPVKDMTKILERLSPELEPFVQLMHKFGLRRNESLGVKPGDVKKGKFYLQRQLLKSNQWIPLKGRDMREIPYWFCTPNQAYKWVESAQNKIVHPRTLSLRWSKLMGKLKMSYTLHDLRHTWTTNAMTDHGSNPLKVRDAAGHENISTTMGYLHKVTDDSLDEFIPDDAA